MSRSRSQPRKGIWTAAPATTDVMGAVVFTQDRLESAVPHAALTVVAVTYRSTGTKNALSTPEVVDTVSADSYGAERPGCPAVVADTLKVPYVSD